MFNEVCGCCLKQWGLEVSLWKATYRLGNSLIVGGGSEGFRGIFLAKNSTRSNPVPGQEASFGDNKWAFGVLSLPLFGYFI